MHEHECSRGSGRPRRLLDVVPVAVVRVHAVRRGDDQRAIAVVRVSLCGVHSRRRAVAPLRIERRQDAAGVEVPAPVAPSSLRCTSAGGRQPLAWSVSDVWIVPSVRCVQQAKTVSTTIAPDVTAATARLRAARQRRRTSRSGASVHCRKCRPDVVPLPPLEHVNDVHWPVIKSARGTP